MYMCRLPAFGDDLLDVSLRNNICICVGCQYAILTALLNRERNNICICVGCQWGLSAKQKNAQETIYVYV